MKPLFVGLAAAAVVAAGGASAVASPDPTPSTSTSPTTSPTTSPSDSPGPTPPETPRPGTLTADITPAAQKVKVGGGAAELTLHVAALDGAVKGAKIVGIRATPTGAKPVVKGECTEPFDSAVCVIGTIEENEKDTLDWTLSVPKTTKKTVKVTFAVTVAADGVEESVVAEAAVTFTAPPPATEDPTEKPTDKPTETKSPSPKPTGDGDGKSEDDDRGSSGSGSSGSSGSNGSGGSGGSGGSADLDVPDYPDPTPNASFETRSPDVALPPIAAPSPSVAPNPVPATPQSRLRENKAPVAQELTFERVASTQVAWLAALLVVFGLLLTQVRLGRRAAPARERVPRGQHRRTRRGMFGH